MGNKFCLSRIGGINRTMMRYIAVIMLTLSFFFIELIVGYMANSLALVADSFHMLSDIIGLLVALVSHCIGRLPASSRNTFGWQRAEIVGTTVNTVILITLAFTIGLDAIKRFFEPECVLRPRLIVAVGLTGLLINVIGLIVLAPIGGGHGHSHGGHGASGHSHKAKPLNRADSYSGHSHGAANNGDDKHSHEVDSMSLCHKPVEAVETGGVLLGECGLHGHGETDELRHQFGVSSPPSPPPPLPSASPNSVRDNQSNEANYLAQLNTGESPKSHRLNNADNSNPELSGISGEIGAGKLVDLESGALLHDSARFNDKLEEEEDNDCQDSESVATVVIKPSKLSHSNMGMKAAFLHVAADAMGSVVVVIAASLLWAFSKGPIDSEENCVKTFKPRILLYLDPSLSLLLVLMIVFTSFPLAKKSILILLQSVPNEINIHKLKEKLRKLDGVHQLHDLHIWRLRGDAIIATVHVQCCSIHDFDTVSRRMKQIFHSFDIHCTTIQPEFLNIQSNDLNQCLLKCGSNENCGNQSNCCPQGEMRSKLPASCDLLNGSEIPSATPVSQSRHPSGLPAGGSCN